MTGASADEEMSHASALSTDASADGWVGSRKNLEDTLHRVLVDRTRSNQNERTNETRESNRSQTSWTNAIIFPPYGSWPIYNCLPNSNRSIWNDRRRSLSRAQWCNRCAPDACWTCKVQTLDTNHMCLIEKGKPVCIFRSSGSILLRIKILPNKRIPDEDPKTYICSHWPEE